MKKRREISVDDAKNALWEAGELSWKMRPVQQVIKKGILDDTNKSLYWKTSPVIKNNHHVKLHDKTED